MLKTAECVSPKHPDKICDRISDAILDECLRQDPNSRCAIETMGGHNIITITGEMTTDAFIDIREIVKQIVGDKYGVQTNIVKQSPDIAGGIEDGGAGDQGIMVGYACNQNEAMIPQELYLARELCKFIYYFHSYDGKTQITIDEEGEIKEIVASFCNIERQELMKLVEEWFSQVGQETLPKVHINPAGDWSIGGFEADTGLTGRKLIVDNYGPQIPIGGGAFSGKDATKVDRSGAYMARNIAVNILKAMDSKEVLVKLAYAIGVAEPVMVDIIVDGMPMEFENLPKLKPNDIIKFLKLKKPIFQETAEWGAFGNGFEWDKYDGLQNKKHKHSK
jgi:S-adenosylmethionine synthetase